MTGFDLYERLAESDSGRRVLDMLEEQARERDGVANEALWQAEDDWIICYTTSRVVGGPHDGRFLARALRPVGPGARTGNAKEWRETYRREFATRKAAKRRADALYRQHSPKWDARWPDRNE